MDTLTTIFGSHVKVKILRLFFFNPSTVFFLKEIVGRTRCPRPAVLRELSGLIRADIVKKKYVSKDIESRRGGKTIVKKGQGTGFALNEKFPYLDSLKNLLTVVSVKADESLAKRLASAGKMKLIVAAGVFIQNWDSRVDLLIVGDSLHLGRIESVIKVIESEIGKEIAYSAFETPDFEYRMGIHDRLVRDILDYPHVVLLDKLGAEPQ